MDDTKETCKVDITLLPMKGVYFFLYAGCASLMPFITIYMKMLGLSMSETALICGTMPFIHGITRTFIGGLADKLNAHRATMIILCLLTTVFYSGMVFVPRRMSQITHNSTTDIELHCGTNGTHFRVCNARSVNGNEKESDSHDIFAARVLFFKGCKWTCDVEKQQNSTRQTQIVLLKPPFKTVCRASGQTTTVVFGGNKVQPSTAHNCRALRASITDKVTCRCYYLESVVVGDDSCEGMVCDVSTTLRCKTKCSLQVDMPFDGEIMHNKSQGHSSTDRTGIHFGWVFWSITILYFFAQMTMQPMYGIIDAMLFNYLGEKRNKWGRERLWGTVGFAIFGPVSGLLMDNVRLHDNEYAVAFLLFAVCMTLTAVCTGQFNSRRRDVSGSTNVFKDTVSPILKPETFVLLALIVVFGIYLGFISTFLFWYLKLLGDVPQILFGLCLLSRSSLETVVMFFSETVFRTVGHVNCFSIVCVAFAIRFASYSFIRNPWMVLLIEPLHAITFGLMYAAASTYASRITPPGNHGSVQNIIASLHFCYGRSFGTLLGGRLFETYGGAATFRMFAASSLILLVLHVVAQKFWIKSGQATDVIELDVKHERHALQNGEDEVEKNTTNLPGESTLITKDVLNYKENVCDGLLR